jgi:hypothetical protein
MKKAPSEILAAIKANVENGLPDVMKTLGIEVNNHGTNEKKTDILLSGWQKVKDHYFKKWVPQLTDEEEEDIVTYLKKEMSRHSIKDYVKHEYKEAIIDRLGMEKYHVGEIDPDIYDKIETLSFGANIAYNTILSIMNENLEILMADPYKDEAGIREDAEDFWLSEVFGNMLIEYIQYGEDIVNELDNYAVSKNFCDGFINDMAHHIYNRLFNEKLNEIKSIRAIFNIQ